MKEETAQQRLQDYCKEPSSQPGDAIAFADYLIGNGVLTKWQVDNLLAGKSRGFHIAGYVLLGFAEMTDTHIKYLAKERYGNRKVILACIPKVRAPMVDGQINAVVESFVDE